MSEQIKTTTKKDDVFALEDIFPDAEGIFNSHFKKLEDAFENSLIVLDTNVLLLPYSMGNESLNQLKMLYQELIDNSRLFIPKRVAREYARNRNKKLAEIHHSVLDRKTGKTKNILNYPILENLPEKKALDDAFEKLEQAQSTYYQAITQLAETIRAWEWSDPVSSIYSELFTSQVLIEHEKSKDELITELDRRFKLQIPPGYKDSSKDDGGVGDLSIWLSILHLSAEQNRDIIFVTEDIKPDWWNQSNGSEFLPRYELIDEFRRNTNGNTLHIVRLSKLLELFKVQQELIESARNAEKARKERVEQIISQLKERRKKESQRFSSLTKDEAISEIKEWFFSNYEDPAESCPYESAEGGFQFIWGGPYDAREEIESEYEGIVPQSILNEVIDELESTTFYWSGIPDSE